MASLEYLAGFIDGEGSIQISRNKVHFSGKRIYSLRLSVHQIDRRPLDELNVRWPGSLRLHSNRPTNARPIWEYVVTGSTAADVITSIRPFLVSKGEQADLALAFQTTKGRGGGLATSNEQLAEQERLYEQMGDLKGTQALRASRRREREEAPTQ